MTEATEVAAINAFQNAIIEVLTKNAWIIIVICVTVVIILYSIIGIVIQILKAVNKKFENCEYIEIGKVKIKNRNYVKKEDQASSNNGIMCINGIEVNRFLSLVDLVISNKIVSISQKVIENMNTIKNLENEYQKDTEIIFRTTFTNILNDYHQKLIEYACKVSNFSIGEINRTREYFFISDMLKNLETMWLEKAISITERNGFVKILDDKSKASTYIDELNSCIAQAIDIRHIEVTAMRISELNDIIDELVKNTKMVFEGMFIRLGELKKTTCDKKHTTVTNTNEFVMDGVNDIMKDIVLRILNMNDLSYKQEVKNETDKDK